MLRTASSLAALLAASCAVAPAAAADWDDWGSFRGSSWVEPKDWTEAGDQTDSLGFEFGTRYWYSMGSQDMTAGGGSFGSEDTTHLLEGHLRIEDARTNTFVKGLAGYSMVISGSYDSDGELGNVVDGKVGYAGADIGYMAFGGTRPMEGFGPLVGYLFWNDSPNTTRASFTTATSADDITWSDTTGDWSIPFDSVPNDLNIHALRLGLQGRAKLGEQIDVTGEVAAVPYAKVSGTLGSYSTPTIPGPTSTTVQSSPTSVDGWGYGAMAEGFVGFHPSENLTFRLGGRAWYLQGTVETTFDRATIVHPSDSDPLEPPPFDTGPTFANQGFIEASNPFSLFRYGLLAELTYRF